MPKYSICIAAYKSQFLKECIESILSQIQSDFELIILNDCSPNPVKEIVEIFKDCRIKYFNNSINTGAENLVNNWNKCLNLARGEFIIIMGDDDLLEPNYLSEFDSTINKFPNLDVYHCRSQIINEESIIIDITTSLPEFESVYGSILERLKQVRNQFISDFVYRASALRKNEGFYTLPLAWASDDITAYMMSINKGIAHVNKPIFKYRKNQSSITSTGNSILKMKALRLEIEWLKFFLKTKPCEKYDLILWLQIMKVLPLYIRNKKSLIVAESILTDPVFYIVHWFKNAKKFNLNLGLVKYIIKTIIKCLNR